MTRSIFAAKGDPERVGWSGDPGWPSTPGMFGAVEPGLRAQLDGVIEQLATLQSWRFTCGWGGVIAAPLPLGQSPAHELT